MFLLSFLFAVLILIVNFPLDVAKVRCTRKGFVQKILKQKQTTGHVQPQQQGGSLKSVLNSRTNDTKSGYKRLLTLNPSSTNDNG